MHELKPAKTMSNSNVGTNKVKPPADQMKPKDDLTLFLPYMTGFEYLKPVTKPKFGF